MESVVNAVKKATPVPNRTIPIGEEKIVEAAHEVEAFVFVAGLRDGGLLPFGDEPAQCIGLGLRQHAGRDRGVEVLALDGQSFSTVTLRLV